MDGPRCSTRDPHVSPTATGCRTPLLTSGPCATDITRRGTRWRHRSPCLSSSGGNRQGLLSPEASPCPEPMPMPHSGSASHGTNSQSSRTMLTGRRPATSRRLRPHVGNQSARIRPAAGRSATPASLSAHAGCVTPDPNTGKTTATSDSRTGGYWQLRSSSGATATRRHSTTSLSPAAGTSGNPQSPGASGEDHAASGGQLPGYRRHFKGWLTDL